MTLDEIAAMDKPTLTPAEVAAVIGCDPQDLRVQAWTAPEKLGFPTTIIGHRVRFPRLPFIQFMTGEK